MRTLFQFASDRAGEYYPSRLSPEAFWTLLWLTVAFAAIHMVRRARRHPAQKPASGYNLNQRLFHWGNLLLLAVVAISGYWIFFRRSPATPVSGISWLDIHIWSGLLFAAGVVAHAVAAVMRGDWRSMRPEMKDLAGAGLIWRNFLGRTSEYPAPGKYDPLQKIFHHLLALLAITFTLSGLWMWLSAERYYFAARGWLHTMRLVHDLSAVTLVVMVIGHLYFSLLKVNRANLKDMAGLGAPPAQERAADD